MSSRSLTLGVNIQSLNAQRRLGEATNLQSKISERLASGQRINTASDDPAGLAISESLNSSSRVFAQGIRNVNDGISLLAIADSTIEQLSSVVIRIRELAEQSANGTFSSQQRKALNIEAQALAKEFFRVSRSASFNKRNLFDGSMSEGLRLQAGYGIDGGVSSTLGGKLGDGSFTASNSFYGAGTSTEDIAVGDINGDGISDLVAVGSTEVSVRLGAGDGTFGNSSASPLSYAIAGSSLKTVSLKDMNNDGILDITAGGSLGANGIFGVALGRGDGTFQTFVTTQVTNDVTDLAVGDLNNDGFLDIAYTQASSNKVRQGNGDGTFNAEINALNGPLPPRGIGIGDINNDGNNDLLMAGEVAGFGVVFRASGNGDMTFTPAAAPSSVIGQELVLTDLNTDGYLDVITAGVNSGTGSIKVHLGSAAGLSSGTIYSVGGTNAMAIEAGDFNGDGNADVATSNNDGSVSIRLGMGDGTLEGLTNISSVMTSLSELAIGDFNGDGVVDLLAAGASGGVGSIRFLAGNYRDGLSPILPFSLSTIADARQAMGSLDKTLSNLSNQRGIIGAFQSRLAVASENLMASRENYLAASSRIVDADIAFETASLARVNILQQSASAILSQANQIPNLALSLLRNS